MLERKCALEKSFRRRCCAAWLRVLLLLNFSVCAVPAKAQLFGTPKFKIEQSDDRFSTSGLTTYSGFWNRISKKSIAGGVHIDSSGVFVEPIVIKRKSDGALDALFLFIHNETSLDTTGTSDLLAFGGLRRISFLTGEGDPIVLEIERARIESGATSYDRVSGIATSHLTESGFAKITPAQYERLLRATALAVQIVGERRSFVYETRDISKTFQANLRFVWDRYVASPVR